MGARFIACPDRPWGPPSLLHNECRVFPGGKKRPARDADPSALLLPWSGKSRAIPLLPYGPYSLYRASVPVQYSYTSTAPMGRTACTEPQCLYSTAIPLLPLCAVRPVHSLSACTVELYLYSLMRRTVCKEPQCLHSTAIPLLPLWAVRPVHSLSACTRAHFPLSFNTRMNMNIVQLCSYTERGRSKYKTHKYIPWEECTIPEN